MMKKLLATAALSLFASQARAQSSTADVELNGNPYANINQGNIITNASMTFAVDNANRRSSDSNTYFDIGGTVQYFLVDHLALGAGIDVTKDNDGDTVGLAGPLATWYFWNTEKLAAYTSIGGRFGFTDVTIKARFNANVGFDYFVTPSVSVGPYFSFQRVMQSDSDFDYNRFLMGAGFAILL